MLAGLSGSVWAQPILKLSSGSATPAGSVALNLSLSSPPGSEPSAFQWTFSYPAASVASIKLANGPALTAAGKSITCTAVSAGYACIAYGLNSSQIFNGVVSVATVTLSGSAATAGVGITNAMAATAGGASATVTGTGGTITVLPAISSLSCNALSIGPAAVSICTVHLSGMAPAGGVAVALSSSVNSLSVPGSVTVTAGSSTATVIATARAFTTDQNATVNATLNNTTANASIQLVAPALVSAVQCGEARLTSNAAASCTVTLNKSAPSGGATISLSSDVKGLSVPVSVSVAANSSTASFPISAATIASTQTATIMASANGSSASATVLLVAITVSSVQCDSGPLRANTSANCTVIIGITAPSGGAVVALSSDTSLVSVPASATVPANSTSVNFPANAGIYTTSGIATISASAGANSVSTTLTLGPATLLLNGIASELSGKGNGAVVTPSSAPSGLTGKVIVNGAGSVNFDHGGGVYFLNCCVNSNNAYYKFTGNAVGNLFNLAAGQISFQLESRYSFAQRQVSSAGQRNAFDVRDGSGVHVFEFITLVVGNRLVFAYLIDGIPSSYYVPAGTEDQLFGIGVSLRVTLQWDGHTGSLYLNHSLVNSLPYISVPRIWNTSSNFNFGAGEYLSLGGYSSSDDIVSAFTVN